ncbi:hypothetical protein Hanom_Chr09g00802141 [Helianthus anomalus]
MKILVGFLLVLIFGFQMSSIDAVFTPQSSPTAAAPIASIPSSMTSFTVGTESTVANHQTRTSRKLLIGLVTTSLIMVIIIMSTICLWKCHRRKMHKVNTFSCLLNGLPEKEKRS